ncbi:dihydrodipicolinate reductase [Ignisphaera aggregans DSM 17230]|uniref:Dihydrodipicolinate reductase n=1 Tax=Ignisphaera aggregans (strain DSM 17230 / JCM 13409 / AQ1.S1) TaxID=583356 RepID=E0SRW7_IGNAA|nr:dihydrodipicolinate reductase [Ignisphaera aggregans DSM 17230]
MFIGIYGFGSIGRLLARVALERGHEIIGVVDIDPNIVGRDVGEILGLGEKLGIEVSTDPYTLTGSEVILHATGSYLDKVYDQIIASIDSGADVVSTCETLAYPYYRYPILARKINERAIDRNVSVIGTGINPGFLLDTLAIVLAAPFNIVNSIRAIRSIDAAKRRESFRKKIGIGEDIERVREMLRRGEITGHVGYAESVMLIADKAGINLTKVIEGQEPIKAEADVESSGIRVGRGLCKGIKGFGAGYIGDREIIRVEFYAYVGAEEFEEISISGRDYSIRWRSSGTPGDMGTAAIVLSIAENIVNYGPGLLTMADIIPFRPYIKVS